MFSERSPFALLLSRNFKLVNNLNQNFENATVLNVS